MLNFDAKARRRALLVSASFPLSVMIAAQANAQSVTISASDTVANVNTAIDNERDVPNANLDITINTGVVIAGPGTIVFTPNGAGKGDGAITFTNNGNVGAVNAGGVVTDPVSVSLSGTGGLGSTLTASNTGLITAGVATSGFGGGVSFTNGGTIYGGVNLNSAGTITGGNTGTIYGNFNGSNSSGNITLTNGGQVSASFVGSAVGNLTMTNTGTVGDNFSASANGNVIASNSGTVGIDFTVGAIGNVTVTNSGTVTDDLYVNSGGNATVTNTKSIGDTLQIYSGGDVLLVDSGTVGGDLYVQADGNVDATVSGTIGTYADVSGYGDVSFELTDTGAVRNGTLTVQSDTTNSTTIISPTETHYVHTSGDAYANIQGDVANSALTVFGNAYVTANANASADIGGNVGYTRVYSDGGYTMVENTALWVADARTETLNQVYTAVANSATANVTGTVHGDLVVEANDSYDSTRTEFDTRDAGGNRIKFERNHDWTDLRGLGSATVAAGGEVTNGVYVEGGDATALIQGTVGGEVDLQAWQDSGNTYETRVYTDKGIQTGYVFGGLQDDTVGDASLTIEEDGEVGNGFYVWSGADSTVVVDGYVGNDSEVDASGDVEWSHHEQTWTSDGLTTLSTLDKSGTTVGTGVASVTIGATGQIDGYLEIEAFGGSTTTVSGNIADYLSVDTTGTNTATSTANTYDPATLDTTYAFSVTRDAAGGASVVDIKAGGSIDGSVSVEADGSITYTNAGVQGGDVSLDSVRTLRVSEYTDKSHSTALPGGGVVVTTDINNTGYADKAVGDAVSFTNTSLVGPLGANVTIDALGDVTIVNSGTVRGTTDASSFGQDSSSDTADKTVTTFTPGATPPEDVTETVRTITDTDTVDFVGGSVTGTYSGANGTTNFSPSADGSITQQANGNSTATISGSVYGNVSSVSSYKGFDSATRVTESTETTVINGAGDGTHDFTSTIHTVADAVTEGTSSVTITGEVVEGNAGIGGDVSSEGAIASNVNVKGGHVGGDIDSFALGGRTFTIDRTRDYAQTIAGGIYTTAELNETFSLDFARIDGTATVNVTNGGIVGGDVEVTGANKATGLVDATSSVSGDFRVQAVGGVAHEDVALAYARDSKTGIATASATQTVTRGSGGANSASATIAGTVGSFTSVSASNGDATLNLTGVAADGAEVVAVGQDETETHSSYWSGLQNSSSTNFSSLTAGLTLDKTESVMTSTATGGTATLVVDTALPLAKAGVLASGYGSTLFAYGLDAATITISGTSHVGGDVEAYSFATNYFSSTTELYGASHDLITDQEYEVVGGTASVTNDGIVDGSVMANGMTAVVTNNGVVNDDVRIGALFGTTEYDTTDIDMDTASNRVRTRVETHSITGGSATGTNNGTIDGNVYVAGATGSWTNNSLVAGTTVLGVDIYDYTVTSVETDTTTTYSMTQPTTLFSQTYTANNNGVSGGYVVTGATITNPLDPSTQLVTSDVTATINLNSGSATLGNISAEVAADGTRLTDTTLNLNGSGFLGADYIANPGTSNTSTYPSPFLTLDADAYDMFGGWNYAVTVRGVETMNKTGSGTFVIFGAPYAASTGLGDLPDYTLDIGAFNITAGEVQLATYYGDPGDYQFGISGDVNNSATLVLGRRFPSYQAVFGSSLVSGPEVVYGTSVVQVGDFTQSANGTLVVGFTPTLARYNYVSVDPAGFTLEPLGPVTGGVSVYYFTTPDNSSIAFSTPSGLDIDGNLNLAGHVVVSVSPDGLYADGDGYTLITYTGTGSVTATADPSIASNFVDFSLVHTPGQVRLVVDRTSYATVALDPNAASAATAFDSALASAITRIRTDAMGGSAFTSVEDMANAQDVANIASALDFRLTTAQAAQVFEELSSAEVYASLDNVDQNMAFADNINMRVNQRSYGGELGTGLWINPVGSFAVIEGGEDVGASDVKVDSYGAAFGFDVAYLPTGVFGIGGAYAEHNLDARHTNESGRVRTWTIGAYASQGFGPLYGNAMVAFGFSRFSADRDLELLARHISGEYRGRQLDASLEVGYDAALGNMTVTPFGRVVFRSHHFDSFTEEGGAGIGLRADDYSDSWVVPTLGVKIGGSYEVSEALTLRPFARLSYAFNTMPQSEREFEYLGGGDSFVLKGVEAGDYGQLTAGFEAATGNGFNVYVSGGYDFGANYSAGTVRAGVSIQF